MTPPIPDSVGPLDEEGAVEGIGWNERPEDGIIDGTVDGRMKGNEELTLVGCDDGSKEGYPERSVVGSTEDL